MSLRRFALAACALLGSVPAQDAPFRVLTRGGEWLAGRPVRITEDVMSLEGPDVTRAVPMAEVLGVIGPAPTSSAAPALIRLVGGDLLRGDLGGGDTDGETFVLVSRSLGRLEIALDRLQRIEFPGLTSGASVRAFEFPADVDFDEAVFVPAKRGFDSLFGYVHRFTEDALEFAVGEAEEPRRLPFAGIAAIALQGGFESEDELPALLTTRTGDRVRVRVLGLGADGLHVELEGGVKRHVPLGAVSGLALFRDDAQFLSMVEPAGVRERSWFAEDDELGGVWPWRRDANVAGGALVVGGYTASHGLGCHARARFEYVVPGGFSGLVGAVGVDDSVLELGVRGVAKISIQLDGVDLLPPFEVRSGATPVGLGRLDVRPGARLVLLADFGPGLDLGDRVDWLMPAFVR